MRTTAFASLLFALSLLGSPKSADAAETFLRSGTKISTRVIHAVDLKKARTGDSVVLEVNADVRDPFTGGVLVPRGAKLLATITYLGDRPDKTSPYMVRLEATRVEWEGGFAALKGNVVSASCICPMTISLQSASKKRTAGTALDRGIVRTPMRPADPDHTESRPQLSIETRMRDLQRDDPSPTSTSSSRPPPPIQESVSVRTAIQVSGTGMMLLPLSEKHLAKGSVYVFKHRPPGKTNPLDAVIERAVAGDAEAQFQVGYMYHHGEGVDQEYSRAIDWYLRAAEQGHGEAQMSLAVLYATGQGVPQDDVSSYMWFSVASPKVSDRSASGLRLLERRMTSQQIEEGKKRAEEWSKSHHPTR